MPSKRLGDADGSLRKKLGAASRTGQACDRCKVRKIRCDARPGGCSPCLQNNSECKTTDRITGRAVQRGHTESIEYENNSLRVYMLDLQQQLRDNGVEPKHPPAVLPSYISGSSWTDRSQEQDSWGEQSSAGEAASSSFRPERTISQSSVLPDFRPGCIGDNYLGISPGSGITLSPIAGTRLSLFGLTLDLAEFLPPQNDPLYDPLSYDTFLRLSTGRARPPPPPALPNLFEECKYLADHFFKAVLIFLPVLHRPDFMKLLSRVYHAQPRMSQTEEVMLHMMLGIMKLQGALRNGGEQLKADAIAHYHYAISFVPDLLLGHKLEHIQALALICLQLRQQPRLGAAWSFTNTVIGHAIELGLHRSADAWQSTAGERSPHVIEMRKRVFWSLLVLHVSIGGKLGRPMPVRIQDMDIEMPEPVSDNIPGEAGQSKWRKCSFRAAIPGMKLTKILMQVYATVYSVRPDAEPYEITVRRLEKELDTFREQLPQELSGGPQTVDEDRVPALYLQTAEEEVKLILHHPALDRQVTPETHAKNMDICLEASKRLLLVASELQARCALDTTWYYATDYLAAIFTTLFTWRQRQGQMNTAEFNQLTSDMDRWLGIMGDVGILLGTGYRLREHLNSLINQHLTTISQNVVHASASVANSASPISPATTNQSQQTQQSPVYPTANGYTNTFSERAPSAEMSNAHHQPYGLQQPMGHGSAHPGYPPANQYYQGPQPVTTTPNYPGMSQFDATVYHPADAKQPGYESHVPAHTPMIPTPPQHQHPPQMPLPPQQQQHHHHHHHHIPPQPTAPTPFMPAFQQAPPPPPPATQNGYHPPSQPVDMYSWRAFAHDTNMNSMNGQDYMTATTALMNLSGDKNAQQMPSMGGSSLHMAPQHDPQMHWPQVQYGPMTGQ